jgi:lipopolysaccharide biosynthesis glycosyltransferase
MGTTWAKLDLIKVLPIERVIYLDADILVRGDIKPLWDVDLCGKPLAAVQDVGYPLGHEEIERGPYFNAGVLLMDLTQIRKGTEELERIATKMKDSKYRDQDVLNVYFKDQWAYLRLEWNAQGLGTYADSPGGDRDVLRLEEMVDAKIVHFTGPVRPALEHVLNPYIQPCTCKPWGYLGAPGHPYREEWWQMLEKTNWASGWRTSFKYIEWCKEEVEQVKRAAIVEFDRRVEHQNGV